MCAARRCHPSVLPEEISTQSRPLRSPATFPVANAVVLFVSQLLDFAVRSREDTSLRLSDLLPSLKGNDDR